ncbi:MAG: hypothetical protein K1X88_24190 [Nannocystaceae bacterium]|nr:hypothetical protein [Nannocystaceae bacterium]
MSTSIDPSESPTSGLARLVWMGAGNAVLLLLALSIARLQPWTFSWRDLAYAVVLFGVVWVRWVDVNRLGGRTADGDPATPRDWQRWALALVLVGSSTWALAQSLGL